MRTRKRSILNPEIFTLKDALRKCGHREDYRSKYENLIVEHAAGMDCSACNRAKMDAYNKAHETLVAKAKELLTSKGIDISTASFDTQISTNDVCVTLWLRFKEEAK